MARGRAGALLIVYLDSSILARAFLRDEDGHEEATTMLSNPALELVTGTWTRVEVSSALVRAARAGRIEEPPILRALDAELRRGGRVAVISAERAALEEEALHIVRTHGIRSLDAWHLAAAKLVCADLAEPGEDVGFASRDVAQAAVAVSLGFQAL